MNPDKIEICFIGEINTKTIAELTSIFSNYNVNILDISMYNTSETQCKLIIICSNSSTTDEIDSFWNDLQLVAQNLNIQFLRKDI